MTAGPLCAVFRWWLGWAERFGKISLTCVAPWSSSVWLLSTWSVIQKTMHFFTLWWLPSSEYEFHFCLILMVRASHRASPDSRKEELDSTSFFFFLAALCAACGILFRNQGSAAMSAAMEVLGQWNLKHWATIVVPRLYILMEGVACAYNGERHWWWPPSETIHHTQWAENLNFGKIETKCFMIKQINLW